MKFIHISDLHFGKNLFGYSMVNEGDQKYWVERFFELVDKENPDAIVIAGDVYDRGVPPKEAVELLDYFMTTLAEKNIPMMMIAGNHDSGTRLSFGSNLFEEKNVYIAGEIEKEVKHVTLNDEYGEVTFWLVPYLFPAAVQVALKDESITGYDQAMRRLLEEQHIDFTKRNVIISHQTVLNNGKGPEVDGSETAIGGVGDIEVSAYDGFDYVALGHIHAAQKVRKEYIRYSGSPLCYHFGELRKSHKGPVIVELGKKGEFSYRIEELSVLHPLREVKGLLSEIVQKEIKNKNSNEYIRVVITDDIVPSDARQTLLSIFDKKDSKLMEIVHEPANRINIERDVYEGDEKKTLDEFFIDFYRSRNNDEFPSEKDQSLISFIAEQVNHASEDEKVDQPSSDDLEKIIQFVMKQEDIR